MVNLFYLVTIHVDAFTTLLSIEEDLICTKEKLFVKLVFIYTQNEAHQKKSWQSILTLFQHFKTII